MSFPVILARACLLLYLVLLCACASIPLSTALRLSSLDERALVQLEPAAIRIKVALPRGNTLNPEETRLVLRLQPDGEAAQVATMPLWAPAKVNAAPDFSARPLPLQPTIWR